MGLPTSCFLGNRRSKLEGLDENAKPQRVHQWESLDLQGFLGSSPSTEPTVTPRPQPQSSRNGDASCAEQVITCFLTLRRGLRGWCRWRTRPLENTGEIAQNKGNPQPKHPNTLFLFVPRGTPENVPPNSKDSTQKLREPRDSRRSDGNAKGVSPSFFIRKNRVNPAGPASGAFFENAKGTKGS